MGLLEKFGRVVPATPTADTEESKENASFEESRPKRELDSAHQQHIEPEIEKVVRRKLDRHVIPLVTALCLYSPSLCW